jgi:PAS domain S-box-containing protein
VLLASIIASCGDAIITNGTDGRIATWNPAAERLFGFTAREAIGQPLGLTVPPEYDEERRQFLDHVRAADTPRTLETKRRRKDGSLVDVEIVATTMHDAAGAPIGTVSIVRDISERTRDAAALAELVAELQDANRKLAHVNQTKSDFVSMISHEFRTPLTSIRGFSELLETEELTSEEVRAFAHTVNQNAIRLTRMIGDVLDLDALEAGHREIRREPFQLNLLVLRVLDALQSMTEGHRISTLLDPALPPIRGDADLLERVITNLVANAVKYSPTGGPITLTTAPRHNDVELTVADAGMGVPPDHRETIFSRYGRIARPEQEGIEGTGLGLPIARHILEVHNGRIWVEDNTPAGSIFHVVLPAADSALET